MVIVKDKLKDDIRFMLTSLVSQLKNTDEDYNTLIADIYNDLDNLSTIDLYVMREYVKDSVNHLKAEKQANKIPKKGMLAAKMKVISDDVGNFYVVVEKNGEERIVLQTTDKNKADQYVRDNQSNVAMAAAPEDELEDDVGEDLTSIPEDDLPNTRVNKPDDEDDEDKNEDESDIEELDEFDSDEVDAEVLEEINELIDRADHLISVIDNSIDVVPDLDAITELVNIKVSIQDKMDELNSIDPSSPDIDEAMEALRNELEEYEDTALDIINKNTPWVGEDKENKKDIEDEEDESVEESVVVEEEKEFVDDMDTSDDDLNNDEDIDEFKDIEDEDLDVEDMDVEELEDEELDDEELNTENIDELIEDLLNTIEDVEEKVESIKDVISSDKDKELIDNELEDKELNSENLDKELDEESNDEELDEDKEIEDVEDSIDEKDKSLESSILSPSGESLEKGEKKDPELEPDTPVNKMIPEDEGVGDVGREKPDKKPDGELPLNGLYPLKAEKVSKNSTIRR